MDRRRAAPPENLWHRFRAERRLARSAALQRKALSDDCDLYASAEAPAQPLEVELLRLSLSLHAEGDLGGALLVDQELVTRSFARSPSDARHHAENLIGLYDHAGRRDLALKLFRAYLDLIPFEGCRASVDIRAAELSGSAFPLAASARGQSLGTPADCCCAAADSRWFRGELRSPMPPGRRRAQEATSRPAQSLSKRQPAESSAPEGGDGIEPTVERSGTVGNRSENARSAPEGGAGIKPTVQRSGTVGNRSENARPAPEDI